jgi:multiple sugar transport system ATP-binding protein
MNFLAGRLGAVEAQAATVTLDAGGTVKVPCGAGGAAAGESVKLGVRPEHIRLAETGAGDVTLAVTLTEQLGGESYLHGTLPSGEALSVRLQGQTGVSRGASVGLKLAEPAQRHLFHAASGIAMPPLT